MNLVIVESPTKSKTLQGFLGPGYKVLSSYGHMRDLPESELGIDVENDFKPKYIIIPKAKKNLSALKAEVKKADSIILATDEDREGEAIAWHLVQALGLNAKQDPKSKLQIPKYERIVFHEITKSAIEEALENSRDIDINLVDAQQARRVLDRLVGYKLSPFLWKKVTRGLSAGRVQSVAVRLVCEREDEIKKFKPEEYWLIEALLRQQIPNSKIQSPNEFVATLTKINNETLDKLAIKNKDAADKILGELEGAEYKVINIEKKETRKNPLPPFATSTLQQEAWKKFHFSSKWTMRLAQNLYERGFITYHRTDSLNLSTLALGAAKKFIAENYGENYYQFRKYKAKGRAQEAHEAIRPAYPDKTPDSLKLDGAQKKLYSLIWRRFIACQMSQAIFDSTAVDIEAQNPKFKIQIPKYMFRATGQTLRFDGFLKVYPVKFEEMELPPLEKDEILELSKLTPTQHFTQPPSRYNEASLIKVLEQNGIGRPSTYAPILSTIQERNYIEKNEDKRFQPTEIGRTVNDLLVKHFPEIVDIQFTAKMENDLDEVAEDKKEWVPMIKEFYEPFAENLERKYKEVVKKEFTEKATGKKCPKCGSALIIRLGKYGKFYACSKFPKCRYTETMPEKTLGIKCPKCQEGDILPKRTGRGKIFYGCTKWPKCNFALWDKPIRQAQGEPEKCPECGALLVETKRKEIKCSNKECKSHQKTA